MIVTFHNTPKLILTNPNHPQCYGTQSASHPTPTNTKPTSVTPPALQSHLAYPTDRQTTRRTPDRTPIACLGIVAVKTLGTNYPHWRPGHPSPYLHLGLKPDLGPHRDPDSVFHIVL